MKLARSAILFFASLLLFPFGIPRAVATARDASSPAQPIASTSLPLRFELNVGQVDAHVDYLVRTGGFVLFLAPDEAVYQRGGSFVRMQLVGADPDARREAVDQLPGVSNYLIGNDPSRWRTNVPSFGEVRFASVYPGVDLRYYESDRALEYDVVVAPGADPSAVSWKIEGADSVTIDPAGDLVITSAMGTLRQHAPVMYQERDTSCSRVPGSFVLFGTDTVAFDVGDYDRDRPLVIDPTIAYSTYLGGANGSEVFEDIGVGLDGSTYIGGATESATFPLDGALQGFGGVYDMYLTRLSPSGSELVFSTYIGGAMSDFLMGCAIESDGGVAIAGTTQSDDFPTANAFQPALAGSRSGIVARINPEGNAFVFSTYLGGTQGDVCNDVAVGPNGDVYTAGVALSSDFPTSNPLDATLSGGQDGFVARFDATGSLLASTYIGGSFHENFYRIAVDPAGAVYVAGNSDSTDYPTAGGAQPTLGGELDVVVTKFNAELSSILYGTYLGGASRESPYAMDVDSNGAAYIGGYTLSSDYPVRNPVQASFGGDEDGFVTKLNPSGATIDFSTFIGAEGFDYVGCVASRTPGVVYAGGASDVTPFAIVNPIPGSHATPVAFDGFIVKIDTTAPEIVFSTLIGGDDNEAVSGLAIDALGSVYAAGDTRSADFPVVDPFQPAIQPTGYDTFVTKITEVIPPDITGAQSLVVSGKPFRIKVTGTNFQQGLVVTLGTDSTPWPTVKYKNETAIVLKGAQLKQHFPKGVPTEIRVDNPDGGSDVYMFTR